MYSLVYGLVQFDNISEYTTLKLSCWKGGSQLDPALGSPCPSLLSRFS